MFSTFLPTPSFADYEAPASASVFLALAETGYE
jgi:hypothetical protein